MQVKTTASLIDINVCVSQVDNKRYDLVLIGAARMRELKFHRMGTDKTTRMSEVLFEIQEGRIDPVEYLRKIEVVRPKKQFRKYK